MCLNEKWYPLRDLKRRNAFAPSYRVLAERGFEVFTPMKDAVRGGERQRVPVLQDLLFVHATRERLDPEVALDRTLQYRYARGARYREPMVVRDEDMNRFMRALQLCPTPRFYLPSEVSPQMIGRQVRIVAGPFEGWEGRLLFIRGSHKKRLFVEIPDILCAGVEVESQYITFI